jgi:hypothetical protein
MPCWTGKWKGGRTYRTQEGRTVYVLRKMVQGKHYEITLEARNEMEAEAELALFLRDPGAYQTRSEAARTQNDAAVYLDAETVGRFLEYLQGQGRTARYVRDVGTYLAAWAEALAGRNLRRLTLQEVLRELARHKTARKNRITALKSFTAWLREGEAVLPVAEDCTLARLFVLPGNCLLRLRRLFRAVQQPHARVPLVRIRSRTMGGSAWTSGTRDLENPFQQVVSPVNHPGSRGVLWRVHGV